MPHLQKNVCKFNVVIFIQRSSQHIMVLGKRCDKKVNKNKLFELPKDFIQPFFQVTPQNKLITETPSQVQNQLAQHSLFDVNGSVCLANLDKTIKHIRQNPTAYQNQPLFVYMIYHADNVRQLAPKTDVSVTILEDVYDMNHLHNQFAKRVKTTFEHHHKQYQNETIKKKRRYQQ